MNTCQKCNQPIANNEIFATLDYNIETMKMENGGLSVEVISSETIHKMCKQCAINNDPKKTKAFLKRIVMQDRNGN